MAGFFYFVKVNKALKDLEIDPNSDLPRAYKVQMMDLGKRLKLRPEEVAVKIMGELNASALRGSSTDRHLVIMKWMGEGKLSNLPDDFVKRGFVPDTPNEH